jgi:hypothetical protein
VLSRLLQNLKKLHENLYYQAFTKKNDAVLVASSSYFKTPVAIKAGAVQGISFPDFRIRQIMEDHVDFTDGPGA